MALVPSDPHPFVSREDPAQLALLGQQLYERGGAMRDLATIMQHPEMRAFYDKYMCDPHTALAMLRMMQLYTAFEVQQPDPYARLGLVHTALCDAQVRQQLFHANDRRSSAVCR